MTFKNMIDSNPQVIEELKQRFIYQYRVGVYKPLLDDVQVYADGQLKVIPCDNYMERPGYISQIYCSITNPLELTVANQLYVVKKILYAYGARSDKYSKSPPEIRANDLLNNLSSGSSILCPHSCINGSYSYGPEIIIPERSLVIFPDKSAEERMLKYIRINPSYGVTQSFPYISIQKTRTESGVSQDIPVADLRMYTAYNNILNVIVIDDICDAGSTFEKISEALPPSVTKFLVVIHGVFTYNYQERLQRYNYVVSTDSYLPSLELANNSTLYDVKEIRRDSYTTKYFKQSSISRNTIDLLDVLSR